MMKTQLLKNSFFILCVLLVVVLGSVRSAPVYGKLDFILLDGRPWWRSWQPMIEQSLSAGSQPFLSDSITCTVLRAVFAQPAVTFRFNYRFSNIAVEDMIRMNRPMYKLLPAGPLALLLHDTAIHRDNPAEAEPVSGKKRLTIKQLMIENATAGPSIHSQQKNTPYRCIINLHGFTPSWVPSETKHWTKWLSRTASFYTLEGVRLSDPAQRITGQPFENCLVFY